METRNKMLRLALHVLGISILFSTPSKANGTDPAVLFLSSNGQFCPNGGACVVGNSSTGEGNPLSPTTLTLYENGNGQPLLANPVLLLLGIPGGTTGAPTGVTLASGSGTRGGPDVYGGNWGASGLVSNFNAGSTQDVYAFLGMIQGNGSESFTNWSGADTAIGLNNVTSFGIAVYKLTGTGLTGGGSVGVTFSSALPLGSVVVAYGCSVTETGNTPCGTGQNPFTTPFTQAGVIVGSTPSSLIGMCEAPTCQQAKAGEPVSTGNGNYYYHHTDFVLPGPGLPIVFTRSYNTLDDYTGPLGANWTDSYDIVVTQPSSTQVIIKWGDGHGETFTQNGGVYVPQPGVFSTLVKNVDGTFLLTRNDQTQYLFAASGKLTSITDKNGNAINLTYDGNGNLTTITNAAGRSLTLTYDASNRVVQVTDLMGRMELFSYDGNDNLVTATDPLNGTATFAYDANHRVTSITLPDGNTLLQNTYDSQGRVISQTNGRNLTWTFAYNTPSPSETTITDPKGNKTVHTYDSQLRIVKITDAKGGTISYTYDGKNDRTSVTNQDGNATQFAYDASGNITGITDALGDASTFSYDTKNDLLTATNPKGKTTTFSYDSNGNLLGIKDALGDATTFAYDGAGELTSRTDADGHTTTYGYDTSGDLTRVTDALGDATNLAYDGIGRLASITDPNGHAAHASYDALSRLTAVTDPLDDKTQFKYDAIGNLKKITDADGNATEYAYDAANNLIAVTDAMNHVTQYGYDADNNRVSFDNADGNPTSYRYDALNRLVTITDPLSFVTKYAYDPAGDVVAVTDADGNTNHFAYDVLNRLIGISYVDGKSVSYAYDPDGNRTSMADAHGTTAYGYDALDRLASVTFPGGATAAYTYDGVGNRSSLTYPDGKVVHYGYDGADRLSGLKDWLGRITHYAYDPAGNLLSEKYPNGAAVSFAYDNANRLTQALNTYRGSAGNPVSAFTYVLDPVGNRLQVTDGSGVVTKYGYNPLAELTSATRDTKVTDYTYDAVGNRMTLTAPGTSINYAYDADDRLLSAGNTTFNFDPNGNRLTETNDIGTVTYAYDSANRLISVSGDGESGAFTYDGDGNRISQSIGTETYAYVNDVDTVLPEVLQETGPDGDISYVYGLGRVSESNPNYSYFYQYDGLGSVMGLTDPNGKLAGRYTYDAWGNPVLAIPDNHIGTENKFRFTGEALDPATGLYYLRARYYDPSVGRFVTPDPFSGFAAFPPQSLNRFAYVEDSPAQYVDPLGLLSWSTIFNKFQETAAFSLGTVGFATSTYAKSWTGFANLVAGGRLQSVDAWVGNVQQASAVTMIGSASSLFNVQMSGQDVIENSKILVGVGDATALVAGTGKLISDSGRITQDAITVVGNHNLLESAIKYIGYSPTLQILNALQLGKTGYGVARTAFSFYSSRTLDPMSSPISSTATLATGVSK